MAPKCHYITPGNLKLCEGVNAFTCQLNGKVNSWKVIENWGSFKESALALIEKQALTCMVSCCLYSQKGHVMIELRIMQVISFANYPFNNPWNNIEPAYLSRTVGQSTNNPTIFWVINILVPDVNKNITS